MSHSKKSITIIFIISIILNCSGPNIVNPPKEVLHGWVVQTPELGFQKLLSVDFVDDNNGWIVGSGGTILHTNNGGMRWNKQEIATDELLYHVQFINKDKGWLCTLPGSIYKTTDGGKNWNLQYYEDDFLLRKVFFVDEKHGWACGQGKIDDSSRSWAGVLLGTIDGGNTWFDLVRNSQVGASIDGVYFLDSLKGWITGEYIRGTFRTEDGGHTWQPLETLRGSLSDMIFFNDTVGISYARTAAVLKTYDSGLNWDWLPVISNGRWIYDMEFVGEQHGWLVGEKGYINHTTDGGESWNHQVSGTKNYLRSVSFTTQNNGWAVGYGGTILHTTDGGDNWISQVKPTEKALGFIQMVNKSIGCAVGADGAILKTTNGGNKWELINPIDSNWFNGLTLPSMYSWYAIGNSGTIVKSQDQGNNWVSIAPDLSANYRDVFFLDENRGWVVGNNYCLKTTDGGNSWLIDSLPVEINSIFFLDSLNGWATHQLRKVFHTSNGGASWTEQFSLQDMFSFEDIYFVTKEHGFVVGQNYSLFETKDGGATWEWIYLNTGGLDQFNSIHFTDSLNGWIVGEDFRHLNGVIYNTTDGGTTWELITKAVETPLYSVFFLDNKLGWICGENGTILHTNNGGTEF